MLAGFYEPELIIEENELNYMIGAESPVKIWWTRFPHKHKITVYWEFNLHKKTLSMPKKKYFKSCKWECEFSTENYICYIC